MTSLLEASHVTKTFGGGVFQAAQTVALEDFSLRIETTPPVITAVVGESGSGKTTLARLLLGEIAPTSGSVHYLGKDVSRLSRAERKIFRRDVQVIFQDPYEVYNPFYKVDHLLKTPVQKFGLGSKDRSDKDLIDAALTAVGLRPEETLGRYPHQLSGGQRQRLMVARALLIRPKLIIADEPVSMVDASLRATILDSLKGLTQELGVSLIYITHDLVTAYQISDNVIVLYRGSITEAGHAEPVVRDPLHPYTRLLINSIPQPDPDRDWPREESASVQGHRATGTGGCKFAHRCPQAMEICLGQHPPLYQTSDDRVAACYLYRDAPELSAASIDAVFASFKQTESGTPVR
ncbi:MAG: ABC transporter ATP-binding protein [Thermomicrobiales bacterium]